MVFRAIGIRVVLGIFVLSCLMLNSGGVGQETIKAAHANSDLEFSVKIQSVKATGGCIDDWAFGCGNADFYPMVSIDAGPNQDYSYKDDDNSIAGARYLQNNLPSIRKTRDASLRDTYYWYYATQFMYHMGGEHWKKWNDRLHPLLVNGQEQNGELAGSWDPRKPVPDRWGPHAGRLYVTTMNLLSLEVHYRHLPLYND